MGRHSRRRTKMENNPRKTKAITSDSIPIDMLIEILLRLPAKSVTRFVSVSKLFATIIRSEDFIRSFSLRSSNQKQRLLLAFSGIDKEKGHENWFFLSSPLKESFSPVFLSHTACRHAPELRYTRPSCVHGLISFVYGEEHQIISNPSTGKSITLPLVKSRRRVLKRFFGYDSVDDRYKVLCVTEPMIGTGMRVAASQCQVLTLGSSHQNSWRKIECSIPHRPQSEGVCNNGALYYYAHMGREVMELSLVRFDVRSETFDFLTKLPAEVQRCLKYSNLINYEGKVASATPTSFYSFDLWVLEDFEKQEWLNVKLSAGPSTTKWCRLLDLRGTAQTGEDIYASNSVEDCYFIIHHRKMKNLKVVEFDAKSVMSSPSYKLGRFSGLLSFLDYVESVMFS